MLLCRLKALLSQCPPRPQVFAAILSYVEPDGQAGATLTLPAITKLLSKLNKRGQWEHGLALFWALPSLGLTVLFRCLLSRTYMCRGTPARSKAVPHMRACMSHEAKTVPVRDLCMHALPVASEM